MDTYRVAPTRPVFLSSTGHLPPPAGRRSGGAELDIFAAERYFTAADADVVKCSAATPADEPPPQLSAIAAAADAASQSGRTAVSSAASWNSRSGLLPSSQSAAAGRRSRGYAGHGNGAAAASDRYHQRGGKKPGSGWGLFGRDCPCAGRKAVTVDVASEPRSPTTPRVHTSSATAREESMIIKAHGLPPPTPSDEPAMMKITPGSCAFPLRTNKNLFEAAAPNNGGGASFAAFPPDIARRVVSSGGFTFPARLVMGSTVDDEPPRESLEVFRPIDEDSVVLVDPPPSMLAAPRGAATFPRGAATDDDAMSDASSDLFDLESFAASSYPTTCRGRSSRRNSRDDGLPYAAAEPALSECMYAPSEASVVWSVVTAEGGAFDAASVANFSSAASACCVDEFRFVPPGAAAARGHDAFTAAMSRSAGARKKGGGFLSSCRCEKAVNVGPTPVRVVRPPSVADVAVKTGLGGGGAARYHHGRVHTTIRT